MSNTLSIKIFHLSSDTSYAPVSTSFVMFLSFLCLSISLFLSFSYFLQRCLWTICPCFGSTLIASYREKRILQIILQSWRGRCCTPAWRGRRGAPASQATHNTTEQPTLEIHLIKKIKRFIINYLLMVMNHRQHCPWYLYKMVNGRWQTDARRKIGLFAEKKHLICNSSRSN